MSAIGIVGGTGPEGLGLALRWAAAGQELMLGSRVAARARAAAETVRAAVPGAVVDGAENHDVLACCERVVLALPFACLSGFLETAAPALAGRLVIDVTVPVRVEAGEFTLAPIEGAPSAGELIQRALPTARVVSTLKHLSAERLRALPDPLEGDVLVCGDNEAARRDVAALVALFPGVRTVDAGRLANGRYLDAITVLLLNLNRLHRARTSIAIVGLP